MYNLTLTSTSTMTEPNPPNSIQFHIPRTRFKVFAMKPSYVKQQQTPGSRGKLPGRPLQYTALAHTNLQACREAQTTEAACVLTCTQTQGNMLPCMCPPPPNPPLTPLLVGVLVLCRAQQQEMNAPFQVTACLPYPPFLYKHRCC